MKTAVLLGTMAMSWLISPLATFAEESSPATCENYKDISRRNTCLHAQKYGLTINAAAVVEGLAERTYAVELCGVAPDPAEQRHTESILASSPEFRALYNELLTLLRQMCIYDPDIWCLERGFKRR